MELAKYNLDEETISNASKLEQWVFLLTRTQNYDAATLRRLLPGIDFEIAIQAIEVISQKTEDKQLYDQREKAQRDYEWSLANARQQGYEDGVAVGVEKGIEKGIEKGRQEGQLIGQVLLLQQLLGLPQSSQEELISIDTETLQTMVADLQRKLRNRNG